MAVCSVLFFFFSSRRRHTRSTRDWSSDVCSSDLRLSHRIYATDNAMSGSVLRLRNGKNQRATEPDSTRSFGYPPNELPLILKSVLGTMLQRLGRHQGRPVLDRATVSQFINNLLLNCRTFE